MFGTVHSIIHSIIQKFNAYFGLPIWKDGCACQGWVVKLVQIKELN